MSQLDKIIHSDNQEKNWWACRSLSSFDDPMANEMLRECLMMDDVQMKICAAKGLQISPVPKALEALCELLAHRNALLRRLAGDAIASLEFQASNSLIYILNNGEMTEKIEAARALSIIKDPISIRALFEQLEGASPYLEYWIGEALDKMGIGMKFFSPIV